MTNTQAKRPSAEELLPCPFCGSAAEQPVLMSNATTCVNLRCALHGYTMPSGMWNRRASLQDRPQQAGVTEETARMFLDACNAHISADDPALLPIKPEDDDYQPALRMFQTALKAVAPLFAPSPSIHTDNTETLRNALAKIEELEAKLAPLPSSDAQAVAETLNDVSSGGAGNSGERFDSAQRRVMQTGSTPAHVTPQSHDARALVTPLVSKWRNLSIRLRLKNEHNVPNALEDCADELEQALAAMDAMEGK